VKSAIGNNGMTVYMPEKVISVNAVKMRIIQKSLPPRGDV
jgi:hypothetical protein